MNNPSAEDLKREQLDALLSMIEFFKTHIPSDQLGTALEEVLMDFAGSSRTNAAAISSLRQALQVILDKRTGIHQTGFGKWEQRPQLGSDLHGKPAQGIDPPAIHNINE